MTTMEEHSPPDLFFDKVFAFISLLIVILLGSMLAMSSMWFPFAIQCCCFLLGIFRIGNLFAKPMQLVKFWENSCYFHICAAITMTMLDFMLVSFIFWFMALWFWTRTEIIHRVK